MATSNNSSGLNNDYWQKCVAVAQQLEAEGKITREACIAALKGDEDTYSEKMLEAAQKVIRGESPRFLTQQEIKALTDQQKNPQPKKSAETPVRRDDTDEKLFLTGAKLLFLHATGLTVPYLAYKAYNAWEGKMKSFLSYHEARTKAIQLLSQNTTLLNAKGEPILTVSELTDQIQVVAASGQPLQLFKFENGKFTPVEQQQPQPQQAQPQPKAQQQPDAADLAEMLASL